MAHTALTLERLALERPGQTVFTQVSLQVDPGDRLALVGVNGAGKSSLLRCLSGEWRPTAGRILYQGQALRDYRATDRARWMGVLPQTSQLNFPLPVDQVIALGRYPHTTSYRRNREIVQAAAATCDLTHLLHAPYHQCSGGEQQRVQLARVLAQIWEPVDQRTRILLLDEPVTGLDLAHQHALFGTLDRFAQNDLTVIFVVHDLNLASRYAARLAVLSPRGGLTTGTPEEILTPSQVRAHFGWPARVIAHPVSGAPVVLPAH